MVNLAPGEYFGNSLNTAENDYLKLCVTRYGKDINVEKHNHENTYLSLLFSGTYLEESNGNKQRVMAGDALLRPNGYEHQNYFDESDGTCFNIEFKKDWFKSTDQGKGFENKGLKKFKASNYPSLYKLLLSLRYNNNIESSFEYVYHWYSAFFPEKDEKVNRDWVKQVVAIINDEVGRFHSLDNLANRVYVHPVYLARAFKEQQGFTIGEYQLKVKVEKALDLLLNSSKCISSISFETGFYDDSHFIRSFKSVYGIPPNKFRKSLNS